MKGDIFISKELAENFRKSLIKQGFKNVPKVKEISGKVPFTNIPKKYWKV
jgi:hypothetical protein